MARIVQTSYPIYPDIGFPGMVAQATAPHAMDKGRLHVPSSATRNPRPGDAIYWDTTEKQYAVPTSAAQSLLTLGILSYRQDHIANASQAIEYEDNDEIQVGVFGTFWVTAGSATEYRQLLAWDRADYLWDSLTKPAAFANLVETPIWCASQEAVAANGIAMARIGYGRVL